MPPGRPGRRRRSRGEASASSARRRVSMVHSAADSGNWPRLTLSPGSMTTRRGCSALLATGFRDDSSSDKSHRHVVRVCSRGHGRPSARVLGRSDRHVGRPGGQAVTEGRLKPPGHCHSRTRHHRDRPELSGLPWSTRQVVVHSPGWRLDYPGSDARAFVGQGFRAGHLRPLRHLLGAHRAGPDPSRTCCLRACPVSQGHPEPRSRGAGPPRR